MKSSLTILCSSVIALLSLTSALSAGQSDYKVGKSFGNDEIKATPVCVSVDAKDQVLVLLRDGTVLTYDGEGKLVGSFKAGMDPMPSTMTVADGKIYLLGTVKEKQVREIRGRKVTRMMAKGVKCCVYAPSGSKESEMQLPEAISANDAHFIGKQLVVGDYYKKSLIYYDLDGDKAKVAKTIDKSFRLCCGIFDFCPGSEEDSLLVANLGAFKVQTFKAGAKTGQFGARGEAQDEFHGCCNPVNVACLGDGSIVTVEKSPTRVKIYDKEGKSPRLIDGLDELVQGCSVIPVAVDSKGALYLASARKKCIVKCVPES